ncbi:transglycosylase SLT domain-containing protein [Halobacillus naozhouensis]|uniref:Transglycosylase SLT domain-containing protein n=1 Tax=Halobacillus naozhouensis TaxID=554880 RepID=A0ABY8J169_9BACI|nr:transglycosylase SLT domain-containing protein [Halobacillus naozhouensis]WFT76247.1 transglycosylase SLT domain-containing protein [Halobacillus naozhouensis]
MATVRELRTKFVGQAESLKATFRQIKKDIRELGPTTEKAVDKSKKSYNELAKETENLQKEIDKLDNSKAFDGLNKASKKVRKEFKETGKVSEKTMEEFEKAVSSAGRNLNEMGAEGSRSFQDLESAISGAKREVQQLNNTNLDDLEDEIEDATDGTKGLNREVENLQIKLRKKDDGGGWFSDFRESVMNVTVSLRGLKYALAGLAPAAIPALSSVTTGLMGLASSVTAAGGGIAGLVAVAIPAINNLIKMDQNLKRNSEQWYATSQATRDAINALGQFQLKLGETVVLFTDPVYKIAAQTMHTLMDVIDMFTPVVQASADAVYNLSKEFDKFVKTDDVEAFFNFMASRAGPSIEAFGSSAINILDGFMELMIAFDPVAQKMEAGLLRMTLGFSQWASSLSETQGFKDFINYSMEMGPVFLDLLKNMTMFLINFSVLLSPVGDAILMLLNQAFRGLNKFVNFLQTQMDKIEGPVNRAKQVIKGLFALFIGNKGKGVSILSRLGLTSGEVNQIINMINKIHDWINRFRQGAVTGFKAIGTAFKRIWSTLWPFLKPLLLRIVSFVGQIVGQISDFWNKNGSQIMKAVKNAFNFILSTVKFVMPAVMAIIKVIWGAIENIIQGGLKFIMGAIKLFTGIFTGDFKKMWQGIKDMFFGAIQLIWGWINLTFFGRIIKGAKLFILGFRTAFISMWKAVKSLFLGNVRAIWINLRAAWDMIAKTTRITFRAIGRFFKAIWNTIVSLFRGSIKILSKAIDTGWNFITNTTFKVFRGIWKFLKNIWSTVSGFISRTVTSIWTKVSDTWSGLWRSTRDIFKRIYNSIRDRFNNIVDRAKELPGKIGDGIGNMASKVKGGITSVINTMARTLGKGINGVIGGVNWVLDKIGIDSQVPKWDVPQYAQGTKGHPGGLAVVGDGKGSNSGSELIQTPDGQLSLSPDSDTLVDLPKGSSVLSAKDTREWLESVPAYSWGVGTLKKAWKGTKNIAGNVKDTALDVWQYISDPTKLFNKALDLFGVETPSLSGIFKGFGSGLFNKVKDGFIGFLKDKVGDFGSFDSNAPGNVRSWIAAAMRRTGVPASWMGPLTTIAMRESGGRTGPSTINRWDSNWRRGTPSMGLMQTIRPTFLAHMESGMGNIMNPIHNAAAAINYIKSRYGSAFNVPGIRNLARGLPYVGYEKGGIVDQEHTAMVGEGNKEEVIIPLEQHRSRAIGLWKEAGRRLGLSGQSIAILYNAQEDVTKAIENLITRTKDQTQRIINQSPFLRRIVNSVNQGNAMASAELSSIQATLTSGNTKLMTTINTLGENIKTATVQAIEKVAQTKDKQSQPADSNSLQDRIDAITRKGGKHAREYFQFIREHGDWLNDSAMSIFDKGLRRQLLMAGHDLAVQRGEDQGKYGEKHYQNIVDGTFEAIRGYNDPKHKSVGNAIRSLIQKGGSAAWKYFNAIQVDGDWANDWITHLPSSLRSRVREVGKKFANLNGYASGAYGIDTAQLAWIAEGGWAESVISFDPAKRASQQAIWRKTGDELGFNYPGEGGRGRGGHEFNQYLTFNSPTPLKPSEISRKTRQASRRMAEEWGE